MGPGAALKSTNSRETMSEHQIVNSILPGDMVLDIGANSGEKAEWYVKRGIRVVCVEPQPDMIRRLNARFNGNPLVEIVGKALGTSVGELPMSICSESPTISTLDEGWKKGRFADQTWDSTVMVEVSTLDLVVARYGVPRYTKIDVEGYEKQVLSGLSSRIGIISFEFTSEYIANAFDIVGMLVRLGYTQFNVSTGEDAHFMLPQWVPFHALVLQLASLCERDRDAWGDIYAN